MVQIVKDYQAKPAAGGIASLKELGFRPSASKQKCRTATKKSDLTVVKTEKNGNRVTIDQEVIKKIGDPKHARVDLNAEGIAIGVGSGSDANDFRLSKVKNKVAIYSSELVAELTEAFELDFTNVTSISFQGVEYLNVGGKTVAYVRLLQQEQAEGDDSEDEFDDADADPEDDSNDEFEFGADADPEDDSDDESEFDDADADPEDDSVDESEFDDADADPEDDSDDEFEFGADADPEDDSEKYQPLVQTRRRRGRIS